MSTLIHLVRHCAHADLGETLTGRIPGRPLTAAGRAQAARLAQRMAGTPLTAVQSSPRERARETAEALANTQGLAVMIVDALDEIDFGAWQGQAFETLSGDANWHGWNARRSTAQTPGGETMRAAVGRMTAHLSALAEASPETEIACVTHCDMIRGAVAHTLGLSLDHLQRFDVDPGSVTTIELGREGARVVRVNGERP